MKKIFTTLLIFCFTLLNISPAFAIISNKKEKAELEHEKTIYEYINLPWWQSFQDDNLERYIVKAIENNHDLKLATLKVEEARQNVKVQFANELPTLTVGATPAISKMPGVTQTHGAFVVPVIASYEIDIFLKNHDKTKSVKKLYEASKLSEKATYISIVSAVGATYYNIVKADKLIDLQKQILNDRKEIYNLMKQRNEEGITSTSDLVKAEKAYILAEAELYDLEKVRTNLLTSLAVLIGDSPENINEYARISYDKINNTKQIPEKISSEIITQRPDYLIAEKLLEKSGIDVRVAKKEFLPSFNLGGLLGVMAMTGGGPIASMSWKNTLAGAGIMGMLPVLTGGKRIASLKIYKNRYEQAIQEYHKTNISAIKEVNDTLSNLQIDNKKYETNLKALNMEQKDFGFSQDKYNEGIISYLDLIQKREMLLSTEKMTADSDINVLINQISLYKATAASNL